MKEVAQPLQICGGVEVAGRLLGPEAALQVGADRGVAGVPRELADVVDVVDGVLEGESSRRGPADLPARLEHPGVERRPDHAVPLDQRAMHIVTELASVRHQRSAVGVARRHRAVEAIGRLPEALAGQVGRIEDHPERRHLREQAPPRVGEGADAVGAVGVGATPGVSQPDDAQTVLPPEAELVRLGGRTGPFHADDDACQRRIGVDRPGRDVDFH